MIPLELTHQVLVPEQFFQYLQEKEKDYPFAKALYEMMKSFREVCKMVNRQEYPPAHDPCVIYHILRPQ